MSGDAVDLGLLARQQRQIMSDTGSLKDDMGVMMAILMRLDGTIAGLINEIRAIHSQQSRVSNRLRALETTSNEASP